MTQPPKDGGQDYPFKQGFVTPMRASAIGMYLFLAALFMLFAAGILAYVIIRLAISNKYPELAVVIPKALWISTTIVVVASLTIQFAVGELRREHQAKFRRWLLLTMLLAIAFVIVQAPSMVTLLGEQRKLAKQHLALYGLVFVLILVHAAHVIGGIVSMAWTSRQARRGAYDHENYHPVARVALYWHFLDVVWLVMFFTFLLVG
jgi:cytochrome c oxidase subunit III